MQNAFRGLVRSSNASQLLKQSVSKHSPHSVTPVSTSKRSRWCCAVKTCNSSASSIERCPKLVQQRKSMCFRAPGCTIQGSTCIPTSLTQKQRPGTGISSQHLAVRKCYVATAVPSKATGADSADAQQEDDDISTEDDVDGLDDLDEDEMQQMLEDDDQPSDATSSTPTTEWGSKGLMVAEQVLQKPVMQELALFSFVTSPTGKQLKIRLDKPSDEYGSPSLDELSEFSRSFADEYSIALGAAADDVSVEVSSPGAERQVRLPQDLLRFQHLPMSVAFQLENTNRVDTKVLDLVSFDEQAGVTEWKLADVKQNRTGKGTSKLSKKQAEQRFKKPLSSLQRVNLFLEV